MGATASYLSDNKGNINPSKPQFKSAKIRAATLERIRKLQAKHQTDSQLIDAALDALTASPIPPEHRETVDLLLRYFEGEPRDPAHERGRRRMLEDLREFASDSKTRR